MNFIVFDLEWNQGKLGKKDKHHDTIPFEIIEIGAVKLDENCKRIDPFQTLIKPQIYRDMPQLIEQMLHVDMKELERGATFPEACERFLTWCGKDPVFCTWGNQDLLELQRNMLYFGIAPLADEPFEYLDVQKLFSIAFEDGKTRRSLEYAIDFLQIDKDIPFHRAYADAYYTAKIFERIDADIRQYCSYDVFWLPEEKDLEIHKIFPDYSKYISREFESKKKALADKEVVSMRCYICGSNVKKKIRWFSPNGRYYIAAGMCPKHGFIKGKVRLRKHPLSPAESEAVYVDKTQKLIDEEEMKIISEKRDKVLKNQKKKLAKTLALLLAIGQLTLLPPFSTEVFAEPTATEETEEQTEQEAAQESQTLEEMEGEATEEGSEQEAEQAVQKAEDIQTNEIVRWPQGPAVSAEGAILIEADTGTILYGKNIHEKLYPASTTKILTTLIASENSDLKEKVKFSSKAVNSIERASSNMGIDIGQELTMEQCLYGILVYSANEVANAVAEHVGGSIEDFVDLMNKRAAELGCTDSHFVTTNGLHDDNHYTTPYDLAQIGRAFFANETLAKISGTNYYHIPPSAKQPDDIELYTHNQLTRGKYQYEGYVGGKTGYTTVARQTLVTCAERGGMRLICVVMREESPNQYLDTMSLFDYGFQNFRKINVAENETRYTIREAEFLESTDRDSKALICIDPDDTIVMPNTLSFDEINAFMSEVGEGEDEDPSKIAKIDYTYENTSLGSAGILLSREESAFDFYDAVGGSKPTEKVMYVNIRTVIVVTISVFVVLLLLIQLIENLRNFHFSQRGSKQNLNFRKKDTRPKMSSWQRRQYRRQNKIMKGRAREKRRNMVSSYQNKNHWKRT
ncbi:MAG: serine hydrolase [Lachnospiraceae bacterium]|nr:serine hydrolase [Lachnospiraceae bacterium]